jgi:hypothetical protein
MTGLDETDKRETLEALRHLRELYSHCETWCRDLVLRFDEDENKEAWKARREVAQTNRELGAAIRATLKQLIATGFSVPDEWMDFDPVGNVGYTWEKDKGRVVSIKGGNTNRLQEALRAISCQILRLEAEVEPTKRARPRRQARTGRPKQYDDNKDRQIMDVWESVAGTAGTIQTYTEFVNHLCNYRPALYKYIKATAKGVTAKTVRLALDRARKKRGAGSEP